MIDEFPAEWLLYLRKSVGYAGLARQRTATTAMIERRGGTVIGEFSDADRTAFRNTHRDLDAPLPPRPGFDDLLAEAARRPGVGLGSWHADRFGRDPESGEILIRACRRGGHLIATKAGGDYDVTTANGRSHLRADINAANDEVDHNVERMLEAKAEAAAEGRWLGGPRPFGWAPRDDGTLALHDAEAAAVADGTAAVLAGATVYAVRATWHALGLTGTRGAALTDSEVRRILMRPRNAGLLEHRGQLTGPAQWQRIVEEEAWRACCAILADPGRKVSPGPAPAHLMSGVALCGTCGAVMTSKSRGAGRQPGYRCSLAARNLPRRAGPHAGCRGPSLDEYVRALVITRLKRDDAALLLAPDRAAERGELLGKRAAAEAKARRDFALREDGDLTDTEFAAARRKTRQDIAAADAALAELDQADAVAPMLAGPERAWDDADLGRRQAAVSALMHVTIWARPANCGALAFDPDQVDVRWVRRLPSDG